VQELVRAIAATGDVYEGFYEGWYCVGCEAFKQEKDLVDGKCPLHSTVDWIKEKNHFFRLSKYRDALLAHFAAHPEFVEPEARRNEILKLLESGLDDISISRAGQSWGIPVPHDPSSVGLRLVRRADQLRRRRRASVPTRRCSRSGGRPICT
jgi:methionyl-tRNA synthetase